MKSKLQGFNPTVDLRFQLYLQSTEMGSFPGGCCGIQEETTHAPSIVWDQESISLWVQLEPSGPVAMVALNPLW